jgi:outer membrane protein TolC
VITVKVFFFLAFLISSTAPTLAADDPRELADEAVRVNPGIEALTARTRALSERAKAAGTWEDPRIGIAYVNAPVDSFRLDRAPMSGLQFSLQQNLPEWGWSKASKEVAASRVKVSRHTVTEAKVQLKKAVEVSFWKLALSDLLSDVTRAHLGRTQDLLDAIRAHYEVGTVGQSAILRLSILRDRLQDDLSDFQRIDREISAGLNRALSRPAGSSFAPPKQAAALPVGGAAAQWLELAHQHRPSLKRIREEVRGEQQEAKLARIKTRPDVNVWAKYRLRTIDTPLDDGTDFVSIGLSVPITWGSRKKGLSEQAAHLEAESGARARLGAAIDQIESELHIVEAAWARAYEKATTYGETLIPLARTTLKTTQSDFSVGTADFTSLYESEVELLMLEKEYLTAAIETHIQSAIARSVTGSMNLGDTR